MKSLIKKAIVILLSFALLTAHIPVSGLSVYAAGEDEEMLNVSISDEGIMTWETVQGASRYCLEIGDEISDKRVSRDYPARTTSSIDLHSLIDEYLRQGLLENHGTFNLLFVVEDSAGNLLKDWWDNEYSYASPAVPLITEMPEDSLGIEDGILTWDAVEGASKYAVSIKDEVYEEIANEETADCSFSVDEKLAELVGEEPAEKETYHIWVTAWQGSYKLAEGYTDYIYPQDKKITYIELYNISSVIRAGETIVWGNYDNPENANVDYQFWRNVNNPENYYQSDWTEQSEIYEVGETYRYWIVLSAEEGYQFSADLTIKDTYSGRVFTPDELEIEIDDYGTGIGIAGLLPDVLIGCIDDEHTFGEWENVEEPSCTENGENRRVCEVCGTVETEVIPASGHDFAGEFSVVKEATCTESGMRQRKCANCDEVETEEIPATGHDFAGEFSVVKEATCTESGTQQRKCANCDEVETEEIPALGHLFSEEYTVDKEATCIEEGSKSRHCERCDEVTDVTVIEKTEHTYGSWVVTTPATLTEEGEKQRTCSVCGEVETEVIPVIADAPTDPLEYAQHMVQEAQAALDSAETEEEIAAARAALEEAQAELESRQTDLYHGVSHGIPWRITKDNELILGEEGKSFVMTGANGYWDWNSSSIGNIKTYHTARAAGTIYCYGCLENMFSSNDTSGLKSVDLTNLDTTNVTSLTKMFSNARGLESVDISGFNTSSVTDMSKMFSCCQSLVSADLSGIDTSAVTNMSGMFEECESLAVLDISGFDTGNVTDMSSMFYRCFALEDLDVSGFDTSNVTDMGQMFRECSALKNLDVSGFVTSNVTDMAAMFHFCEKLTAIDVSGFDTSKVETMQGMFDACRGLKTLDLSGFDTSQVSGFGMDSMFHNCENLESLDISGFDTSEITYMAYMFGGCESLKALDISSFDTSKVWSFDTTFSGCKSLTELDVTGLDTSSATDMHLMFSGCESLRSIDISGFDTSKATEIYGMFASCSSLESIDISAIDTDSSPNLAFIFSKCSSLETLDMTSLDISTVTSVRLMFEGCTGLKTLDISNWDTTREDLDKEALLKDCTGLETIVLGENTILQGDAVEGFAKILKRVQTLDGSAAEGPDYDSLADYDGTAPGRYRLGDSECDFTGHIWGEPEYTWHGNVDDRYLAIAVIQCQNEPSHVITEEVTPVYEEVTPAGCETEGEARFKAVFTNPMFETQYSESFITYPIEHDWEFVDIVILYPESYSAIARYKCRNDETHTDTYNIRSISCEAIVPVTCTTDGIYECTAVVPAGNSLDGVRHEKTVQIPVPATGHNTEHLDQCEPTYSNYGYTSDCWYCFNCNKYFRDEACTEELAEEEVVLPPLPRTDIKECTITVQEAAYDGTNDLKPVITIVDKNGYVLKSGQRTDPDADYRWSMITPGEGTVPGTYTVSIYGLNAYTGYTTAQFVVTKGTQTITGPADTISKTYGNGAFMLGAKTDGDGALTYQSSKTSVATVSTTGKIAIKGAGTATITIAAAETDNYLAGTKSVKITVAQRSISGWTFPTIKDQTWTGKALSPALTIKSGSTVMVKGTDYTAAYSANKNVGKAKVVITGKGNYKGTKTLYFKIIPKGTSLGTLTPVSKGFTAKWTKQASKMSTSVITGYQIQLATDSGFTKNKKTVTVKGYSKVSQKITGLTGGKKYYVRIRTYKTVSGTNYYSTWSATKTVTTKK